MSKVDLIGKKFNKLTVIEKLGIDNWHSQRWLCQCDCGKTKSITTHNLIASNIRSCGCLRGQHLALPNGISVSHVLIGAYKRAARLNNREFTLSQDEFLNIIKQPCFYCGSLPSQVWKYECNTGNFAHNGIDRVDNSRGYTPDNIVPCCKICNRSKGNMSQQEFYTWIKRLSRHYKKPASISFVI